MARYTKKKEARPNTAFAQPNKMEEGKKGKYPIPDKKHYAIAKGFAKMHGDTGALKAIEQKAKAKGFKKESKKKDDPWDRPSDSTWHKHKGKIVGGALALATAAGVGHKLYKSPAMAARRRVKVHADFWKRKGGFQPKHIEDIAVINPSSKDIAGNAARAAEATVLKKPRIEVNKHDVAHAEGKAKELKGKRTPEMRSITINKPAIAKGENEGRVSSNYLTRPERKVLESLRKRIADKSYVR